MNIKEVVRIAGVLPNNFVTEDGIRYEVHTEQNKLTLDWVTGIWEMKGTRREHCYSFSVGSTAEEAKAEMMNKILKD